MKIKLKVDGDKYVSLPAEVFAQSAVDNKVDLDDFISAMNEMCYASVSTESKILKWRRKVLDIYFSKANVNFKIEDLFLGGSDFEDGPFEVDQNKNLNNKE